MTSVASSLRSLHNRVAIVTGASSGLGRAISVVYAREGARVICADIKALGGQERNGNGKATHELIQSQGGESAYVETDMGESKSVQELMQTAVQQYGRIDM